ncbi:hypothetical protein ABEO98_09245 [Brevibacillus parabrevis]|uniref:hypothetical protein n=1 Tax=Brevibacillus parabrevis TaxID=54914 RepID=UPI002E1F804B|nr:hypothetical protein [Brevibacillus parabrevis]
MDIEKGLRLLAKREQKAFKADAEHLKQIEQNIFAQVKGRKKSGSGRIAAILACSVLIAVTSAGVTSEFGQESSKNWSQEKESVPVSDYFVQRQLESMKELLWVYGGVNIEKMSRSPLDGVFLDAKEALLLEDKRRKLHVVLFPEGYQADQIKIKEDFTRSHDITYTFENARLKAERLPLRASGPTYVYAFQNILFLTNNLEFQADVKYAYELAQKKAAMLQSFSLEPSAFIYLSNDKQGRIYADLGWREEALKQIARLSMQPVFENRPYKGSLPSVFLARHNPTAIVIYNDGKGSDQSVRYRWVEQTKTWELEEKQSLPAKDFAKQER